MPAPIATTHAKSLRDALRDTAVHNTLTLRGLASSRPSGLFNWATKAQGRCIASENGPTARVVAEHDGYRRAIWPEAPANGGVRRHQPDHDYRRAPWRLRTTERSPSPSCSTRRCAATIEPDGSLLIAAGGRPLARTDKHRSAEASIIRGDETSNLGWVSPSFGVRVPADQILLKGNLDTPSVVTVTLLA